VWCLCTQQARDEEYLARLLLAELPALGERVQMIREGRAATNAAENDRQLERSQVRARVCGAKENACGSHECNAHSGFVYDGVGVA
jgi:hypothetical protein